MQRKIDEIEKLNKTLLILEKKKKMMGLDEVEDEKYYRYVAKYIQLQIEVHDDLYNGIIMPFIIDEEVEELISDIYIECGWNLDLLIYEDEINEVLNRIKDKEKLLDKVRVVEKLLHKNLKRYLGCLDIDELDEIMYILNDSGDMSVEIIIKHLKYKFEVFYSIIEGE